MTKPTKHNWFTNAAALRISAACVLSCCLAFGLLPFAAWGAASSGGKAPQTGGSPSASTEQTDSNSKNSADTSPDPLGSSDSPADATASGTSTVPESPTPSPETPEKPSDSTVSSGNSSSASDSSTDDLMWAVGLDDNAAVTVVLHPDGTLMVQGVGKTVAFKEIEHVDGTKSITTPWLAEGYADRIISVEFEPTVEPESLAYWFDGCTALEKTSVLPVSAKDLTAAFRGCESLVEAPDLPEKAETLVSTFEGCTKLKQAPVIPESVKDASSAFKGCSALIAAPVIPEGVLSLVSTFEECVKLEHAPSLPDTVIDMASAFKGCTALKQAPAIPPAVKNLSSAFYGCAALMALPEMEGAPETADKAFFDCSSIVVVPEDFSLAKSHRECFGFSSKPQALVETVYDGSDSIVLSYDWKSDGRVLVTSDGIDLSKPSDDTLAGSDAADKESDDKDEPVGSTAENSDSASNETTVVSPDPLDPSQAQVNITVPSSVPLVLGSSGPNSASIPVSIINRSDAAIKIVGARLKRAEMDYPGGAWSLVAPASGRHFIDDARFTPLGLEAVLSTPVGLPANSGTINLVWEGTFTDYGMKTLLSAASSSDGSFTYGTIIWHVEAV